MSEQITQTVDTYLSMWNETDAARRDDLIRAAWSDDARYLDPLLEATGHPALHAMVDGVHERFPGQRFERTSAVDAHHDAVRFGWRLVAPDGSITVAGIDVGTLDDDGRLRTIVGFFGELAGAE